MCVKTNDLLFAPVPVSATPGTTLCTRIVFANFLPLSVAASQQTRADYNVRKGREDRVRVRVYSPARSIVGMRSDKNRESNWAGVLKIGTARLDVAVTR